jgi:hypothetical protein
VHEDVHALAITRTSSNASQRQVTSTWASPSVGSMGTAYHRASYRRHVVSAYHLNMGRLISSASPSRLSSRARPRGYRSLFFETSLRPLPRAPRTTTPAVVGSCCGGWRLTPFAQQCSIGGPLAMCIFGPQRIHYPRIGAPPGMQCRQCGVAEQPSCPRAEQAVTKILHDSILPCCAGNLFGPAVHHARAPKPGSSTSARGRGEGQGTRGLGFVSAMGGVENTIFCLFGAGRKLRPR